MPSEKATWWSMLRRPPAIYVLLVFGVWWAFVGLSGMGMSLGRTWDFSATAQLGDSFGILSAFMTSMAAIFTYQTLMDTRRQAEAAERNSALQQQEAERARAEASEERKQASLRDTARDKAEFRRDSERTFFGLLDLRLRLLADIQIGSPDSRTTGTDAVAILVSMMRPATYAGTTTNYAENYLKVYRNNINDLGHYLRFTYHIVKFASDNFGRDAYSYVRLLRAQLSNSELILIALNCAHGEGKEKFLKFAERYSLFHNINPGDRLMHSFDEYFRPKAFNPEEKASTPPLGAIDPLTVL
jgi:hypothetical protein